MLIMKEFRQFKHLISQYDLRWNTFIPRKWHINIDSTYLDKGAQYFTFVQASYAVRLHLCIFDLQLSFDIT